MGTVESYYDSDPQREWDRLEALPFEFDVTMRYLRRLLPPRSRIFDIGGGPGRYAFALTSDGHRVTLADLSAANLAFARQKSKEIGVALERITKADVRDLSAFQDNAFNVVLALGPLYHLLEADDRHRAVVECLRVLEPGGLLVLAFISKYSPLYDYADRRKADVASWRSRVVEWVRTGIRREHPEAGFTDAWLADPQEIGPWLAGFPVEKLHLVGVESMFSQIKYELAQLPEDIRREWTDLIADTAETEAALYGAAHIVFFGRKTTKGWIVPPPFTHGASAPAPGNDVETGGAPLSVVESYYDSDPQREWDRLEAVPFEFDVTMRYLRRLLPANSRILDLGGGPGRYAFALTSDGHRVTLADLSAANLAFARQKSHEIGVALEGIAKADARDLGAFQDRAFDVVLALGPLYHLLDADDRHRAVAECLRVLAPGGLLALAFISKYSPVHDYADRRAADIASWRSRVMEWMHTGILTGRADSGFTDAWFADPQEIGPWLAGFPVEKLHLVGVESMFSQIKHDLAQLPEDIRREWTDFMADTAETNAALFGADHIVFFGRKTG